MVHKRPLPGEFEGTLDPDLRVADLYRRARARTDVEIPELNGFLAMQPYDQGAARALLAKHEALEYPYHCRFGVAELEIDEGVFCPTLTNASPFLYKSVDFKPGERVLDAFAGSGAFGVNAALRGAEVVSFDVSPEAVACAAKNARLNGVAERSAVRLGTLEQTIVPGETFDLIIANPPLVPGEPDRSLETALFDPGLQATTEFIAALPGLLAQNGRCYLLTSDVIERQGYDCDIGELCRSNGLKVSIVAQLHRDYESYRVHKIEHRSRLWRHILVGN